MFIFFVQSTLPDILWFVQMQLCKLNCYVFLERKDFFIQSFVAKACRVWAITLGCFYSFFAHCTLEWFCCGVQSFEVWMKPLLPKWTAMYRQGQIYNNTSWYVPIGALHQGTPDRTNIHMLIKALICWSSAHCYAIHIPGCQCWLFMGHVNTEEHCNTVTCGQQWGEG